MSREFVPPAECPVCGEAVPPTARACPGCGADERTGWDEEATRYDGLDLPDDPADDHRPPASTPVDRFVLLVFTILLLLAVMALFVFR